jgi:sugar transferase (PEP-CTERM/EpsH1 system associated)
MKVFVLTSRIPYPLEKGDKLRLFHQVKHLGARHDVVLCCLSTAAPSPEQRAALAPHVQEFHVVRLRWWTRLWRMAWAWFDDRPLQVIWFTERRALRRVQDLVRDAQPDAIHCHLVRCAEYVKERHDLPKSLDFMDAFSAGMHRRSHQLNRVWEWPLRWVTWLEGNRLAAYESRVFDYFDRHTIISKNDRLLIPHRNRDQISIVPNGVDLDAFRPEPRGTSDTPTLLFTGNMAYPPNVDAAVHLAKDILPLVRTPKVRLVLAGAEPKPAVAALASSRVVVTGWVDDMAEEYRRADLFVAPLRMGTGLQNKVLEAMASHLPCVLSPHAFSPLGLPRENHAVVCERPEEYAAAIDRLLADSDARSQLARHASQAVHATFAWAVHNGTLEEILTSMR